MEKRKKKSAASGDVRDKAKKATKPSSTRAKLPPDLVAKKPPPQPKLKHQSFFELVENKDKKKQLESQVDRTSVGQDLGRQKGKAAASNSDMQITIETEPPPGYTFLPTVGNSELTTLCVDLSREHDAMVFVVSVSIGLPEYLAGTLGAFFYYVHN